MKTRISFVLILLAAVAFFWLPSPAQAQFTFTLTTPSVTGAPGATGLTFYGTLTNTGSKTLAYNLPLAFNLLTGPPGADLNNFPVYQDDDFLPDPLAPGTAATLPVFSVAIDPTAPFGQYSGNLSFGYGGKTIGFDKVFVNVANPQAVPEASSSVLLALGLVYLAVVLRSRGVFGRKCMKAAA